MDFLQCLSGIWKCVIWFWWFGFRLESIFDTAPAATKHNTCFKSGQKWLFLLKVQFKYLKHILACCSLNNNISKTNSYSNRLFLIFFLIFLVTEKNIIQVWELGTVQKHLDQKLVERKFVTILTEDGAIQWSKESQFSEITIWLISKKIFLAIC